MIPHVSNQFFIIRIIRSVVQILEIFQVVVRLSAEHSRYGPILEKLGNQWFNPSTIGPIWSKGPDTN